MTVSTSRHLGTLALAASVAVSLTGCKKTADEKDAAVPPTIVGTENIVVASNGVVTTGPTLSGTLTAELNATIRAQVSGSVLSTSAEQGQRVSKGQLLGRLDAAALRESFMSAKSAVASAQTGLDIATRDLQRQETLLKAGAIAPRDLEAAQRTHTSAQAQLEAARAQLANASKNLENTNILAPFAGVVSEKSVSAGDVVQPGTALFTVVDPSTMRLDASVASNQLASVKVGTDVVFSVNGYPGREFHGRITRVSPSVDPTTRQVAITATVPNAGNTLVAGLYAEGRLSSVSQRGIVVPMSAVDTRMQRPAIVRIRNGKVERADVQLGVHDANTETVQIVSGVNVGDTLLVAAAQAITAGTAVKVQAAPADANPPATQTSSTLGTTTTGSSVGSSGGGASR